MAKTATLNASPNKASRDKEAAVKQRFSGPNGNKQQRTNTNDDHHSSNNKQSAAAKIIDNAKESTSTVMTENVFLRVPILIGYVRIVTAILSFYYMPFAPEKACFWYVFSSLTDAIDGLSARWLKQESRVGKLFDMLTDRCSTTCLVIVLSQFYPKWAFALQMFVVLDVCSHWLFVYYSVLNNQSSHKAVDEASPAILRLYYSSRPILFTLSAGSELFFILLYVLHFTKGPIVWASWPLFGVLLSMCLPLLVIKVALLVVQMIDALQNIAAHDVKETKQKQRKEKQQQL